MGRERRGASCFFRGEGVDVPGNGEGKREGREEKGRTPNV